MVGEAPRGAVMGRKLQFGTNHMRITRWISRIATTLAVVCPGLLLAQGVTTGAIGGTVLDAQGKAVEAAQVQITNRSTGFVAGGVSRSNGYYLVQGLEPGGPYTVRIRRIGYGPVERPNVTVSLSQATRVDFTLSAQTTQLAEVRVTATADASDFSPTRQGVGTQVSDTLVSRLPLLTRNFTDLVKLTPQVSRPCSENTSGQTSCGASVAGQFNRFNNYTIDGANQNDRFNLSSSGGLPGSAGGGRIISPDAVREFRVLLSPTDVRQANFSGMLVNAVTKSGTNEFTGSGTYVFRNENLSATNYRRTALDFKQYGFTLGGPIIRDRLHFFVAPEFQTRTTAATGAFVGAGASTTGTSLNISSDSIAYVQDIVRSKLGFDPGTSGRVDIDNPLRNLFGRLDWQLNDVNRVVFRQLVNRTENVAFSRNSNTFRNDPLTQNSGFRLGSNEFTGVNTNNSSVVQVYSNFSNGQSNEFIAGYNTIKDERIVPQLVPEISVGVVPVGATGTAATSPTAAITFGTEQYSIGNLAKQKIAEVQDNYTLPWNAHTFTFGGRFEYTSIYNNYPQGLGGIYVFPNIAALNDVKPSGYAVGYPNSGNPGDIPASFNATQTSFYVQDSWSGINNLTVTAGLRADVPALNGTPSENTTIANLFAAKGMDVHTSWTPKTRVLWSPRIGFNWDVTGDQQNQLRGNVGVFTNPPPFVMVGNALQNSGLGLVRLSCTGASTPAFTSDVNNLPRACLGQTPPASGAAGTSGINLNDPNFKYPQTLILSGGFDRRLPFGFVGTVEGLYHKAINGLRIRDLNLIGPRMVNGQVYTDRNGRVLYADTINRNGSVVNSGQRAVTSVNGTNFSEGAIYLTNQSKDYNYAITTQLRKRFGSGLSLTGAYTYNRAYEVQALTSDRAISNWRFGREYAGLENSDDLTTSAFELRHRLVAYGSYTLPWWKRMPTDLTFYFERASGSPITYVANSDLNGDGFGGNDPIYVPTNALDPNEIKIGSYNATTDVFTQDAAAAQAFEEFISTQSCLNAQRGTIMKRNSCFTPWTNRLDLSVRQALPTVRGQRVSVQLDVINAANAVGKLLQHVDGHERDWGHITGSTLSAFTQQTALFGNTSSGSSARTAGSLDQSMPVYTFNSTLRSRGPYDFTSNLGYLMQLSLRYEF
jgi:hypothetical protein